MAIANPSGSVPILMLLISLLVAVMTGNADPIPFEPPSALKNYLESHPISLKPRNQTIGATKKTAVLPPPTSRNFRISPCPISCAETGTNTRNWTVYHDVNRLSLCNESMLVDFTLHNPLEDDHTQVTLYACSSAMKAATHDDKGSCITSKLSTSVKSTLELVWSGSSTPGSTKNGISAIQQLQSSAQVKKSCADEITFAYSNSAVVGLYAGAGFRNQNVTGLLLEQFLSYVQSKSISGTLAAQLCTNSSAKYSLGIVLDTNNDWSSVQQAVQQWSNADCLTTYANSISWNTISYLAPIAASNNITSNGTSHNMPLSSRNISKRDSPCTTTKVAQGDNCTTLAAECGIKAAEFSKHNPSLGSSCSLTVGKSVCCSSGSLPDNTPQPYANGTCNTYTIQTGDLCSTLAASYDITVDDINNWNNNTWGWMGCRDLQLNMNICLSPGNPPMPTVVSNAVCGPQVNGTAVAPAGLDLSTLNECPLNACCDIWGQCGTTAEFCTQSNSTTGAPGTAAAGQNGCISNCGTEIVYSDAPAEFFKIAYFEGFDFTRPCLAGNIMEFNLSGYTHIHLAFVDLNSDFSVNVSSLGVNFDLFASMSGPKRIVSFGGWELSTSPSTYDIFRQAVSTAKNRQAFTTILINFLNKYDFDGIDIDWEYPGEPDIPGIPADSSRDPVNLFLFISMLKQQMPTGKSLSITAPASFWYLKNYPIQAISEYVDYIVYMTYDLHGQWDYGNKNSDAGCPAGNCLRSDVNLTETVNALSMITKAGVPSNIVVVGVTSYGRSFQMTTPGCYTEMCTYTGPSSGAIPGPCTTTAGYLGNGEIDAIIAQNSSGMLQYQDDSFSDILVYDGDQWVSYMNDDNKAMRTQLYQNLFFGGTVDWALDLQSNGTAGAGDPVPSGNGNDTGSGAVYVPPSIWTDENPTLNCFPPCSFIMPPIILPTPTTVVIPETSVVVTVSSYTVTSTTFGTTTTSWGLYIPLGIPTVVPIPPYVGSTIDVWGIPIYSGSTSGTITNSISIQPSPIPLTITPVWNGTTTVIGGTTSTQNATTVTWGSYTWVNPQQTNIFGGSTSISGGVTGPPITTTFTPGPYPQTTPTTSDTNVNSKTTTYSSATPTTTCRSGCGPGCVHFCLPNCPFCPPDFGGEGTGSGSFCCGTNNNGNPTATGTDTSSTSSSTSAIGTIMVPETIISDPAITPVGAEALAAMNSAIASAWNAMYPPVASSTTTSSSVAPTSTGTPDNSNTRTFAVFYNYQTGLESGYDVPSNEGLVPGYICSAPTASNNLPSNFNLNGNEYQDCSFTSNNVATYISCSGGHKWPCQVEISNGYSGDTFSCGQDELTLVAICPYST